MYSPIPHDLTTYDDKFDFYKNGLCPYQWEISVPQKNCIVWAVVLSYLKSADFAVPGKFEERLNRLTKSAFDPETVKSSILDFNPFFNIHKCFFDGTLQKISQCFKKILSENRPVAVPRSVPHDLQMIAKLLKSNILIVDLSSKNLHLVTPSGSCFADPATITLFCREYSNKDGKKPVVMKRFTFSLNKDLCWELRRDAFRIILESSGIRDIVEKVIQPMTEKKEKKVNILIALLEKNLVHVISELYDSSYILAKLADAGFETDPRVLDTNGFSAFYYALQTNDINLVYMLYRYAANNCYESVNTFRVPNLCIVSNLLKVGEILREDCSKSNNFETFNGKADSARATYQDLLLFNEFLTKVSRGINEIREIKEDSFVKKAEKQKKIIILILENYNAFFSVGELDLQHFSEKELIENYTKNKTYYDNLDFTVALLFFDNIFLLKNILKSPREGFYSDVESSFFLYAVTNKYFTDDAKKRIKIRDLDNLPIFSLLERFNLREKVKNFCRILRERKVVEEDIVQCIPQHDITERLSYFHELKDEFLIFRLDHYIKTALESKPKGRKQKFVIQRALQAIVNSVSFEEENPSSLKHLLGSCLPADVLKVLKKVRDTLHHLKSFQFRLKFETEEDDGLFTIMQSEIQNIQAAFEKIFDVQKIRFVEFLINRGLESAQKFCQDSGSIMHPILQCVQTLGVEFQRTSELKVISNKKGTDGRHLSVSGINEFYRKLAGFVSKVQVQQIRDEIPPEIKLRVVANEKLKEDLDKGVVIVEGRFDSLFLETKDLCSIKKEYEKCLQDESETRRTSISKLLRKITEATSPLDTLDLILEKKKVSDSQLKVLYDEIHFSDKAKRTLNSLIEISEKPFGNNLANLLNRIKHLYEISINEQCDIRFLWGKAKSSKAKQHLVYKIVGRYLHEPSFQASLEMLLFDCFVILKNYEDFGYFWRKDSLLFNSIDLRNVLAFGDPVFETIGGMLDRRDLPSELVKKMLQLFEDRECIETLNDLLQQGKQLDGIPETFSEMYKLNERIVCCTRWKEYSKLFTEDSHKEFRNFRDCSFIPGN